MPTMAVMPMTMPSTVRPERILLVRTVSKAMPTTSLTSPRRMTAIYRITASFPSQRFDGVERRRAGRGVEAEEQPDQRRDADAERHRPDFDRCGNRRERRHRERNGTTEDGADDAAEYR